jgi:hypothetical protein
MLSLLLSVAVLGCSKDGDDSSGESDADTDADADTDTDTDTDVDPNCIVIDGTVTTETGATNDQVRVQMCSSELCYVSVWEGEGYKFSCLYEDDYAFELAPMKTSPRYPSPSAPVTIVTGTNRTFDPVVLEPFTDVYESFTAGTYDFDGGLSIDADPADMIKGGAAVELEGFLAGMVAPFEWGLPIDDEKLPVADQGGTLVAMWYLGQFDVEIANPWPFTATNDYGLAPGTVLDILAMDYGTQAWAVGGTATVSKDGKMIASDAGSGIPILSTLLLVDPL